MRNIRTFPLNGAPSQSSATCPFNDNTRQLIIITGRNEVVAKVMFLQASVILLTGGGVRGCSGGGVRGWSRGGHAWLVTGGWGGMRGWSRGCAWLITGGACVVGHGGVCIVGHRGGVHGWSRGDVCGWS